MENSNIGFSHWLRRQSRRDDPVGDLSRDVLLDVDWPEGGFRLKPFRLYLSKKGSDGAKEALLRAWREYQEEMLAIRRFPQW